MNTNPSLETLFYPFKSGALSIEDFGQNILFLNAQIHPALLDINPLCVQYFKPYADELERSGLKVVQDLGSDENFDVVLIALSKNQIEAQGLIAQALSVLKPDGVLIAAGDNKAGGARLPKMLKAFGLQNFYQDSKNKARVVWCSLKDEILDQDAIQAALQKAQPQEVVDFTSVPGIYGWDKIDKGSALLVENLPEDLKGNGADFGCGYGFLAKYIVGMPGVKSLSCIDADWRALDMCRQNVDADDFYWEDLTQKSFPNAFDFIVMNPPFHEGKKADTTIGQAFIKNAHASLKSRGILWIVANAHLPYEQLLSDIFFNIEKVEERQGFKVFKALK